MAKSPIRKSLEYLIKKVEDLEDQSFAQKLLIDELENKLSKAEETLKKIVEDPFGLGTVRTITSSWPTPSPYPSHTCTPVTDWSGTYCTVCSAYMSPGPTYATDIITQSSSDIELDIVWSNPDELL